jgi:hypothetical protein
MREGHHVRGRNYRSGTCWQLVSWLPASAIPPVWNVHGLVLVGAIQLPRRRFLHLAAGAAAIPAVRRLAWAGDYPSRPVRFILPVVAGGSTDVVARLVAEHLSRVFGQQFIVGHLEQYRLSPISVFAERAVAARVPG